MFEVLIAAFVVMLASLAGIIFIQKTALNFLEKKLPYLISFSAGVFLITALGLGFEVFELVSSLWIGVGLIVSGYVLAWGVQTLLPDTHQHHDPHCDHSHIKAAKKIIIGDSIHNVADGVILVVAFAASPALGLAATLSIFIHEALQEVSEFFVLRQAGYSIKKALAINFTVSSTILLGVGLGYFALASHELEIVLLAVSAGFFLHVVAHDLLPKRHDYHTKSHFFQHLLVVLLGASLMGFLANAIGESHTHGDQSHEEHEEHDLHDIHEETHN